jgi:hypothetical protein
VLRDEDELDIDPLAKKDAAFLWMSRSVLSFATSRRISSNLSCSGFIWPWPGKSLLRIASQLPHPFAQNVLVHVEITCRLSRRNTALPDRPNRSNLELSRKLPSLHVPPPAS